MKDPQNDSLLLEDAQKFMYEIKQKKTGMRLNTQVQTLTDHVNSIMECKKVATPRSSNVINDLLILSENLQTAHVSSKNEEDTSRSEEKTSNYPNSYQNTNENEKQEGWNILKETDVFYKDIKGCDNAIMDISESILIPLKYPIIFQRSNSRRSTGILLYGPPGTGKSMIARATACEISATFYTASCAELTSRWVGGSEKKLKSLFETAVDHAPSIIFLDEIDSVASIRGSEITIADQRLTNQLLIELDNITNNQLPVFVIAATNLPWQIDDAVMRRLSRKVYIPMPDIHARKSMFVNAFSEILTITSDDIHTFGEISENLSGSDISTIISRVKFKPLHILYRATKFIVTKHEDQIMSVHVFSDDDSTLYSEDQITTSNFDDIVQLHGEEAITIPSIVASFVSFEISSFAPTVSHTSRELYKDYMEKNKL